MKKLLKIENIMNYDCEVWLWYRHKKIENFFKLIIENIDLCKKWKSLWDFMGNFNSKKKKFSCKKILHFKAKKGRKEKLIASH